MTNIIFKTLKL